MSQEEVGNNFTGLSLLLIKRQRGWGKRSPGWRHKKGDLRVLAQVYSRVSGSLYLRKAYHFLGGVLIIIALLLLDYLYLYVLGLAYLIAFRLLWNKTSHALAAFLILMVLVPSKLALLTAAIVFTIGDGFSSIIGSNLGKATLPWHHTKTMLGTFTFFLSSTISMWLFSSFFLSIQGLDRWLLVLAPSFAGCLAESLPLSRSRFSGPNDNALVILTTGIVTYGLELFLGYSYPFQGGGG